MLNDLFVQSADSTPIYRQLENQIMRFIRSGKLSEGEALPSVRSMAITLAVNPMTVSKTINRLVDKGWLVHQRGKPTCVASPLPTSMCDIDIQLHAEAKQLIDHAKQLTLSESDVFDLIRKVWEE